MATKQSSLRVHVDASVWSRNGDLPENDCPPDPEEGLRLMRAFLSIGQADVREAVINFVTLLARRSDTRH